MLGLVLCVAAVICASQTELLAQERRVDLSPEQVTNESGLGNPEALVDEQQLVGDPPSGKPETAWQVGWQYAKQYPFSAYVDLGHTRNVSAVWVFDTYNVGRLLIAAGKPGDWKVVAEYESTAYRKWIRVPVDVTTRYLRFSLMDPKCTIAEIVVYEYTEIGYKAMLAKKAAEQGRLKALQQAAIEAANRPLLDAGEPFGKLPLVQEIDCAKVKPLYESPDGASIVEEILGRPCRVLRKYPDQGSYFSYRVGKLKLLEPGATYLLQIEYPEDLPRSMIIRNSGNETSLGFSTGAALGDALVAKYVNNLCESLRLPLSGRYERWSMVFQLHDRFPDREYPRGKGVRPLLPVDGFTVTICQFSAPNCPASHGAAVSRILLYEVPEPEKLFLTIRFPPDDLPRRRIFWREEMADGVIASHRTEERGVTNPLDWYRYKVNLARILGINTFSKDLLEFGACQHWDPTPAGGNRWVHFDSFQKDLWGEIVEVAGQAGMHVLPYYEYAGSKGDEGLGYQRRCKPLTRDDAYTHIPWVENANADITDPETYADFRKMLELTIVRYRTKAQFVGAWIRPRMQLPIGFGPATLARFSREENGGKAVTRQMLQRDKELLERYYDWWFRKRRQFLVAMRDYLRSTGVNPRALILFTACAAEPGPSFPTWDHWLVTDDVDAWKQLLDSVRRPDGKPIYPVSFQEIVEKNLYMQALLSPPLNWGGWEWHHANPPPDPQRYKDTEGVLLTHAFNRAYTVASPTTLEAFRGVSGLALVRHYPLNENMMFDPDDKPKLGYFVADIERAGPYCMLAEAWAVANGDPTYIGYLVGSNFNRGFPKYVRDFNAAFLALPALPSRLLPDASSDPEVVVRAIETEKHGIYLAIVNKGFLPKTDVAVTLPKRGRLFDAATGKPIRTQNGKVLLSLYPCQLRSLQLLPDQADD